MKRNKKQVVELEDFEQVCKERDDLQNQLQAARRANDSLMEGIEQLKAQATEAHDQFQKRVKELGDGLDAATALLKTAQDERDVARRQVGALSARGAELLAERDDLLAKVDGLEKDLKAARAWSDVTKATNAGLVAAGDELREQIKAQEEVIERLKAQNARFVEEQREAKKRAASLAADNARAREEVARLVGLADHFKARLEDVKKEKNQIVEISNGFARERDEIRAEYDARGKVIKKLRKRLHKLKKKLKH